MTNTFQRLTLGSICNLAYGKNLATALFKDDGYDVFGANGIIGKYDHYTHMDEEVLVSSRGENSGVINISKPKSYITNNSIVCTLKKDIDKLFLYYALKTVPRKSFVSGSAQPQVVIQDLEKISFLVPVNKSEQTRIATVLNIADEAIAHAEALIAKYQRSKTGLMQDLLIKGIDEDGNIRSKATHKFQVKHGVEVPEEWEVLRVANVLENIEQGWSPDCESDAAPTNEWGVLKTTAVTWHGYSENENKKLPDKLTPKTQYEIKTGDVLVTRAGPNSRVGVVAYVKNTRSKLILSDKLYRLSPSKKILSKFLAIGLSSPSTQRHLSNLKTGMAESQTNISQKIIKDLSICVPSVKEQERIIERLDSIDSTIQDQYFHSAKLKVVKTGLMQDLLSGKVRVNSI